MLSAASLRVGLANIARSRRIVFGQHLLGLALEKEQRDVARALLLIGSSRLAAATAAGCRPKAREGLGHLGMPTAKNQATMAPNRPGDVADSRRMLL